MEATFDALRAYWTEWGIRPNVGATEAELAAHEARYRLPLPADMRAYFRTVNGMSDAPEARYGDDDLIRFYPLAECRPLDVEWPETRVPEARRFLCFADYSIWGWGYGVRLGEGQGAGEVHVLYDPETVKVADSFGEFLAGYLRRDYAVTYPR